MTHLNTKYGRYHDENLPVDCAGKTIVDGSDQRPISAVMVRGRVAARHTEPRGRVSCASRDVVPAMGGAAPATVGLAPIDFSAARVLDAPAVASAVAWRIAHRYGVDQQDSRGLHALHITPLCAAHWVPFTLHAVHR